MDLSPLRKISFSEGLSNTYDIHKLIFGNKKDIVFKNENSLHREFEVDKWGNLKKEIIQKVIYDIEKIPKIIEKKEELYYFLDNKHYFGPANFLRNIIYQDLIKNLLLLEKKFEYNKIIEIGAGYGDKILNLAKSNLLKPNITYVAADISQNGLDCCQILSQKMGIKLSTIKSSFYEDKDFSKDLFKESIIFTSYSLHYRRSLTLNDLKKFIHAGVKGGVHFEPCSDLYNNIKDDLYKIFAMKYFYINNYLMEIGKAFIQAKDEGIINLSIEENKLGAGLLPHSNIVWHVI